MQERQYLYADDEAERGGVHAPGWYREGRPSRPVRGSGLALFAGGSFLEQHPL